MTAARVAGPNRRPRSRLAARWGFRARPSIAILGTEGTSNFATQRVRPTPARALTSAGEAAAVLEQAAFRTLSGQAAGPGLRHPSWMKAPILCSIRTMYRHSRAKPTRCGNGETNSPIRSYQKPELLATGPNQVWSWDITKLLGPVKWTYFYLYVILDIFSRYVVGWMVAPRESAALAKRLIGRNLSQAGHRTGPAHPPCRSRLVHEVQAGGLPAGRSRCDQVPLPASCL